MKAKENPFRTNKLEQIKYKFNDSSFIELLKKLSDLNYRCAIVGAEGSGKTTLLETLKPELIKKKFSIIELRLSNEKSKLDNKLVDELSQKISEKDIIFLDGAEQLRKWSWEIFNRKMKNAGGLVITCHKEGLLPTLIHCKPSISVFIEICKELAGESFDEIKETLPTLYQKNKGNLRLALLDLYDMYSKK